MRVRSSRAPLGRALGVLSVRIHAGHGSSGAVAERRFQRGCYIAGIRETAFRTPCNQRDPYDDPFDIAKDALEFGIHIMVPQGWWDSRFCAASSFPCQPWSPNGPRPQISKRHRPPGLAGPAGMRCLDPRDRDCNRQKFQRAGGLAPSSSGVLPSDDRRLTVLHRREGGPSSIYFAPASQAACDPVAVRRAEHFGIGGVFSH